MQSKTIISSAFVGTILAMTLNVAGAAERHHHLSGHYFNRHIERVSSRSHSEHHRIAAVIRHEHLAHNERGAVGAAMTGIASVYSGERTANGEYASAGGLTAAHRSLPFGTMVRVTNRSSGRSVVVRINDRGPFVHGRVIDLTPAAAHAIGSSGLAPVTLQVVNRG
jgi:rare lipoprotein A